MGRKINMKCRFSWLAEHFRQYQLDRLADGQQTCAIFCGEKFDQVVFDSVHAAFGMLHTPHKGGKFKAAQLSNAVRFRSSSMHQTFKGHKLPHKPAAMSQPTYAASFSGSRRSYSFLTTA